MKPGFPTNGVNSAVSYKKSSKRGCSINDSKTNNEELDGLSSELKELITNYFTVHNSFLYEDVYENPSDLEKHLSSDSTSDTHINGNCSEDKTLEEDNSDDSQKLYSSTKGYGLSNDKESSDLPFKDGNINLQKTKKIQRNHHLSPFEIVKIPPIPDSFQLPISHETQNTLTFDSFSSENNYFDIKFPTFNSSSLSQDLTKAQRSVRLNKRSNLKKNVKKSTNEKLTVAYKTKECLTPKDIIPRDVVEKSKLENIATVSHNLEMNSSQNNNCDLSENEEQKIYQQVLQSAYDPLYPRVYVQDIVMHPNNENEALCVKKALSKLDNKSQKKLQPELRTVSEKNVEKSPQKGLNRGKNLKKNKALSSETKINLNETNDSLKAKSKAFTQNQNSFSNESKLSKKSTNIVEENLPKKRNLRIGNNLVKEAAEEVSLKKRVASRKKSFPQSISKVETKFDKKRTVKAKAALEKEDVLNENKIEDTDLSVNDIASDLISNEITPNKNLNIKSKAKKNASRKKSVLEKEDILDDNDIVNDEALHAKKSRNNLHKGDVVATDKSFNTKTETKKSTRKKKITLGSNEDILNQNKIVENSNLTINKIGKDLTENKVNAADKHLNTKLKVNRKSMAKKKTTLEKEDILNKNNITENINLPVNEIGTNLIKNKTVVDDQNQKSVHLYKTSTPVSQNLSMKNMFDCLSKNTTHTASPGIPQINSSSKTSTPISQNSSMKNMFDCLNKNTTHTASPVTPQRNSSSFLQLFNKVIESSSSEAFSKSNNSFAKLFEQRSTSKFSAISKITKQFNQKQNQEQLLQPNSSNGSNISCVNLNFFKATEEKFGKVSSLGKKRSNEDNGEVTPSKKRKQNQEPIKRNSENNLNGEVASNENSDEHYNDKITKTTKKQLIQSIDSKPSRRSSRRNQKLDEESNVTSDLCNPGKGKSVKINTEDVKSLAKSHSSCNPASVVQTSSQRNSRTKNSIKIKSVDDQSSNKTKGKTDSLLSTESESLCNDKIVDACSQIKVVEVKSLANLKERKNANAKMKKSKRFVSDSFSDDSKTMEKSEKHLQSPVSDSGQKNRRKNKHLHLTQNENSCATQSEESTPVELNSADRLTRIKRKRKSTDHPDFDYDNKTRRIKKEDKPFSNHKNGIESPIVKKSPSKLMIGKETDFINEMSNANTTQEEDANKHAAKMCNDGEQVCNLSSYGVPVNSLSSEQFREFLSSYTLYPLNPQCCLLYNVETNSPVLAAPIHSPLNLPALMPNMTINDNMPRATFQVQSFPFQSFPISSFISSTQSPVLSTCTIKSTRKKNLSSVNSHNATSVVSDQNFPSLISNKNISSEEKPQTISSEEKPQTISSEETPQTISSTVNAKNASVTSSKISGNSYSNNMNYQTSPMVNNVHRVRISPSQAAWSVEALQTPSALPKSRSELCVDWGTLLQESFDLINPSFIDKLSKNTYGKKLNTFTVKEFCCNPIVVKELSKQLTSINIGYDPEKNDYYFDDTILDEPFTEVLSDVAYFFLRHMPLNALCTEGFELKAHFFQAIYSNFSLLVGMLFTDLVSGIIKSLTFEKMAGVMCLIAVLYIFYYCKKKIELQQNMLLCSSD